MTLDPKVSKYFSGLAKKRKKPHLPFKDVEKAKEASRKGVEARKRKREDEKAIEELRDV